MSKTELEHKINEESSISCASGDGTELDFWVNVFDELSMCIASKEDDERKSAITLDLEKCQQLRQVLDLYEQYLKA
jgi:hypothetical protein